MMMNVRMLGLVVVLFVTAVGSQQFFKTIDKGAWHEKEGVWPGGVSDQCFCELERGQQIDDCDCNVDTVDDFNNKKIFPRLKSLLAKDYFRYFQYQPNLKCPFWEGSVGKCRYVVK